MDQFPRIANLLAANWNEPIAFHGYMNNLLVDRRGGRQGFPSDIKNELIKLRTAYELRNTDHASALEPGGSPDQTSSSSDLAC